MHTQISSQGIAALIEQASRLIHSLGYAEGLYPAQWTALRFFSEAPASARTTAGLARFQGMSLGPVARTVRTLVEKGLLARAANPLSRRADLIAVTSSGQDLLKRDPREAMAATIEAMPSEQREALAVAMEALLYGLFALQRSHDRGNGGRVNGGSEPVSEVD
ncbi:MAG: MarR family transcriptional regulator [Azospirillum sp.]|nr:MarR family transcriptional regulator [Azospirillum sp.]